MLSTKTTSLFSDMQRVADKIKRDVEKQLNESFKTFDVIEDLTPSLLRNDENAHIRMKIRTDDNGHVKVKTVKKEPGQDWQVDVQEYDRGNKAIKDNMQSIANSIKKDIEKQLGETFKTFEVIEDLTPSLMETEESKNARMKIKTDDGQLQVKASKTDPKDNWKALVEDYEKGFMAMREDMQRVADQIQQDVEKKLGVSFKTFEAIEDLTPSLLKNDESANIRMKIRTDNNGHVKVKTLKKEPGHDWEVRVEEYDRGDKAIKGEQGQKELKEQKGQMEQRGPKEQGSQKEDKGNVEIVDA